jgi:hypothetical protein
MTINESRKQSQPCQNGSLGVMPHPRFSPPVDSANLAASRQNKANLHRFFIFGASPRVCEAVAEANVRNEPNGLIFRQKWMGLSELRRGLRANLRGSRRSERVLAESGEGSGRPYLPRARRRNEPNGSVEGPAQRPWLPLCMLLHAIVTRMPCPQITQITQIQYGLFRLSPLGGFTEESVFHEICVICGQETSPSMRVWRGVIDRSFAGANRSRDHAFLARRPRTSPTRCYRGHRSARARAGKDVGQAFPPDVRALSGGKARPT